MAKQIQWMIHDVDEAKSFDFFVGAFGLQIADRLLFPDFVLVYLHNASSPLELELTVNFGRKEPYIPGDGYGHLAVVVDNLDAEHARFEREKLSPGRCAISSMTARRWRASSSSPTRTPTRSR